MKGKQRCNNLHLETKGKLKNKIDVFNTEHKNKDTDIVSMVESKFQAYLEGQSTKSPSNAEGEDLCILHNM